MLEGRAGLERSCTLVLLLGLVSTEKPTYEHVVNQRDAVCGGPLCKDKAVRCRQLLCSHCMPLCDAVTPAAAQECFLTDDVDAVGSATHSKVATLLFLRRCLIFSGVSGPSTSLPPTGFSMAGCRVNVPAVFT